MVLIQEVIKKSWELFTKNMLLLMGMFGMIFLISLIMGLLSPNLSEGPSIQFFLFRIAANLFSMGLTLGSIKIVLDVIGGTDTKIENLFNSFELLLPYVVGYLLFSFGVFVIFVPFSKFIISNGSGLKIIESFISGDIESLIELLSYNINFAYLFVYFLPCFYMWIKIQFFPYFIVSKELGPIDALKKSYEITEGSSIHLILFLTLLMMINLIGLIPFGLGLAITIPFSFLATGVMFTMLDK